MKVEGYGISLPLRVVSSLMSGLRSSNPYRKEVLAMYHKLVKSAFTVPWASDDDAFYVLSESRRLFRNNQYITDVEVIRRKLEEAEMRHGIAVHYLIPYPRPHHKNMGALPESGIAYNPALDSLFDTAVNPRLGDVRTGCLPTPSMGGGAGDKSTEVMDGIRGQSEVDGL